MTAKPSRRRFLLHAVAVATALPGLVVAQERFRRVALLLVGNPATTSHFVQALVDGLARLGWVEGRNLRLDIRHAEGDLSRLRSLATGLLGQEPDAFVASNEQVARDVSRC